MTHSDSLYAINIKKIFSKTVLLFSFLEIFIFLTVFYIYPSCTNVEQEHRGSLLPTTLF